MRLREHAGIIPGRIDILYCKPSEITVEDGYNVRDLTTAEARAELDELKAQVKEHGVLTPLKIRFSGDNIILVEGHRRRTVALELIAEYQASGGTEGRNIDAVPIFPEAPGTTVEERDAGLALSNGGVRLKPLELANLIFRMNRIRGLPHERIAQMLGISMPVLKNHLAMRAMPEEVKEHVREGDISATEAARLVKTLPAGTDPTEAARIIAANKEENKRLGVGKKTQHKVTAKTLQRDRPKAEPKPPAETKAPAPAAAQPEPTPHTGEPVAGAASLDQLQEQIAGLTDGANGTRRAPVIVEDEAAAMLAGKHQDEGDPDIWPVIKRAFHNPILVLLQTMTADGIEPQGLALMYARLCIEREEAAAQDTATDEQARLCSAADVIGQLRFPEDWENAKATTELAQVA
jgi:ParB-like chromosome segregation protein Spo0J